MLAELTVENLAVIPFARLEFSPGLNVISGETGAGKTILAQAISLLLGARGQGSLVRPGAEAATVEALFEVAPEVVAELGDSLEVAEGECLAARRRLGRDGRSRAYLGGRAASLHLLGEVTGRMMAFAAQHEQQRLMMASHQLDILDSFCGREHLDLRLEYRLAFERRQRLREELDELERSAGAAAREAELLRFQLEEIEAASLVPGEEKELEEERRRLRAAAELSRAAAAAAASLGAEGDGEHSVTAMLSAVTAQLREVAAADPEIEAALARLDACYYELEDLGSILRGYAEGVSLDRERLGEVEERLDLIASLSRKYGDGGGSEAVLAWSEEAARRLDSMTADEGRRQRLEAELAQLEAEMLETARALRRARRQAAPELAAAVEGHLEDLGMGDSGFEVRISPREGKERLTAGLLDRNGAEGVEFFVRTNPGMPAAPLRETASGGELSRVMLAVKCAVAAGTETATLVFDEIDAGIGGETGSAVGAKLKQLARRAQVICITHLPQIACYADAHFAVIKHTDRAAEATETEVVRLEGEAVVDELCRMMGSGAADAEARAHADSLLRKAAGE